MTPRLPVEFRQRYARTRDAWRRQAAQSLPTRQPELANAENAGSCMNNQYAPAPARRGRRSTATLTAWDYMAFLGKKTGRKGGTFRFGGIFGGMAKTALGAKPVIARHTAIGSSPSRTIFSSLPKKARNPRRTGLRAGFLLPVIPIPSCVSHHLQKIGSFPNLSRPATAVDLLPHRHRRIDEGHQGWKPRDCRRIAISSG